MASVLKQTYTDWELLLIDDGSTDGTGLLCDELASSDSRISVIHCSNKGPSNARNIGIKTAKGDILFFIDSDDIVDVEWLYSVIEYEKKLLQMSFVLILT